MLAWSFDCLEAGAHPAVDFAGNPLGDGRAKLAGEAIMGSGRAFLTEFRADWEWRVHFLVLNSTTAPMRSVTSVQRRSAGSIITLTSPGALRTESANGPRRTTWGASGDACNLCVDGLAFTCAT